MQLLVRAGLMPLQARVVLAGQADRLAFGSYILLDKIGEGGMGVVYKARHTRLNRIDADKVIRYDRISNNVVVVRKFFWEIEVTARLKHPHIVRAYDAGCVGKHIYLAAMEFVDGMDLAR